MAPGRSKKTRYFSLMGAYVQSPINNVWLLLLVALLLVAPETQKR